MGKFCSKMLRNLPPHLPLAYGNSMRAGVPSIRLISETALFRIFPERKGVRGNKKKRSDSHEPLRRTFL